MTGTSKQKNVICKKHDKYVSVVDINILQGLKFSHLCCWRFKSCGMLCQVNW